VSSTKSKAIPGLCEVIPNATAAQIDALKAWVISLIVARLKRQKRHHELELARVQEQALVRFEALEALYQRALANVNRYCRAENAAQEKQRMAELANAYLEWSDEHFEDRRTGTSEGRSISI